MLSQSAPEKLSFALCDLVGLTALWWWIDRWRKSTAYMDMTLEQQGAYRNLLDEAHLRGGALPTDERILAKACGDVLAWPSVREVVLARFELRPDGWHNTTLDDVLRESMRRAEKQRNYRARGNDTGNTAGNNAGNREGSPSPSPSPSLISGSVSRTKDARDETLGNVTVTPRHASSRPQPIQSPRRKDAAWEGQRVYVPQRMHRDFLGLRQGTPGSDVELELWAWYATVADEWTEGARKAEEPGADMFVFWRARYAEHWPAAAVSSRQAPARMPTYQGWECPHIEPCNNRSTCEIRTAQGRPEKGGSAT